MHRDPEGRTTVEEKHKLARFEEGMMPHMNAAYNLARWLAGNHEDAQDVVQDAYLRAFKFFETFRGGSSRSWLLRIVRNAFYDSLRRKHSEESSEAPQAQAERLPDPSPAPDAALLQKADGEMLRQSIAALPVEYREVLVMREFENCSYKEIADVAGVPLGTVMSRLARAREQLRAHLVEQLQKVRQ